MSSGRCYIFPETQLQASQPNYIDRNERLMTLVIRDCVWFME